jgi:acyl-coenzyme A thioesterase PaaI-like protein
MKRATERTDSGQHPFAPGGFHYSTASTAEIDHLESYFVPLADTVRRLNDTVIRSVAGETAVREATAELEQIIARLETGAPQGPAGVSFNAAGHSWQWGNAAVGPRNAVAPPLRVRTDPDGVTRAEAVLGPAYEGPPGLVHGGIVALLVDHLLGVTASSGGRATLTGTLTMSYRRGTPLGPVRFEGHIVRTEGVKVFVEARVFDGSDGLTVEAEGIWIIPRWARNRRPDESENA